MNNKEKIGVWYYDCFGFTRCSLCGWEHDMPGYVNFHCPSCGASMTTAEGWDDFFQKITTNGIDAS